MHELFSPLGEVDAHVGREGQLSKVCEDDGGGNTNSRQVSPKHVYRACSMCCATSNATRRAAHRAVADARLMACKACPHGHNPHTLLQPQLASRELVRLVGTIICALRGFFLVFHCRKVHKGLRHRPEKTSSGTQGSDVCRGSPEKSLIMAGYSA